ncbi:MAG: histidine phosphatase family protein [Halieaceae bacterium]|jgi:phosphohistidine phosphatase|nr:histidine phosphatase family protein [Halieaceae bacterium]
MTPIPVFGDDAVKTLHLLRHAKSSWADAGVDDHDRELNARGERDAPRMGRALAERLQPQVVHASTARRAQRTLEGLCDGWPALRLQRHVSDESLYTFDWQELLAWIQDLSQNPDSLFLIGHNPAMTELCNQLVGRLALDNLPTAGYLRFSADIDSWSDLTEGIATLEDYLFPRDLPAPA